MLDPEYMNEGFSAIQSSDLRGHQIVFKVRDYQRVHALFVVVVTTVDEDICLDDGDQDLADGNART
jgi:hypothetical protein